MQAFNSLTQLIGSPWDTIDQREKDHWIGLATVALPTQAAGAVRLEARPADDSQEWTEIFPSQLEWAAKQGHQVRAIECGDAAQRTPDAPGQDLIEGVESIPTDAEMRNAVIEECAHAAFAAYGSLTSAQYVMEGPAGLAKRMIGAVKALALPSTNHSPPAGCGSLPSGESDPAVTQDYAGGEAIPSPNREGVSDLERIFDRLSTRLNDALCEMKPSHDDSICGFNEAWDIMRKLFKEEMDRKAKP
jgi:hypothetical protein